MEAGLNAPIHTGDQRRRATDGDQKDISFVAEVGPGYLHGGSA